MIGFDASTGEVEAAVNCGNTGQLKRALKLWDVVAITIGTIIGSGIFASANRVLKQAGSVGHMLLVWVCSGILVTLGALVRVNQKALSKFQPATRRFTLSSARRCLQQAGS